MAIIYAMSDVHGYLQALEEALILVDLESNSDNKLVLCGDYVDYGPNSCEILYKIKELTDRFPDQVIVLKGNHEEMFLEFLYSKEKDIWSVEWLGTDKDFATVHSFISPSCKETIDRLKTEGGYGYHEFLLRASAIIKEDILKNHKEVIRWLKRLPLYYQTEKQIFVHAGIDEEAEEYWMHGTSDDDFLSKYPATFGRFYKDIIAGHISTSSLTGDKAFHGVYWDGESHFYIDGETNVSGVVPVLKYNTATLTYSSFAGKVDGDGRLRWEEYLVK